MEEQNNPEANKIAQALKKFLCFLYVGDDRLYYDATKSFKKEDYYAKGKHMRNLERLLSDKKHQLVPLDKIKLAMDSGLVRDTDTLMFALAMCARQKTSVKLRESTYYFVTEHCKDWKLFIHFIAFTAFLCRMENPKEDKKATEPFGSGRGWRKAVNKWYLDQNATDLAILLSRYKSACGIKHRDILKLSHIDLHSPEVEKQVVLTYALHGLHAALKKFRNEPEAQKQLDYLIRVEKLRMCQNPNNVAAMIASANLTIDHVHPNALKDEIVWEALLPRMDVRTVLKYIPKIAQLGLLKKNSRLTGIIVRILTDFNNLNWNNVLPGEISGVLDRYDVAPNMDGLRRCRVKNVEYEECAAEDLVALTPATQKILDEIIRKFEEEKEKKEIKEQEERKLREWQKICENLTLLEKRPEQSVTEGEEKAEGQEVAERQEKAERREARKKMKKKRKKGPPAKKGEKKEKKKKEPVPVKAPNKQVRNALKDALNLSLKVDITDNSCKRYAVAIRMPSRKAKKTSCVEVGLTIALPLVNRENAPEDATTIIFHDSACNWGFIMKEKMKDRGFDDIMVESLTLAKDTGTWSKIGLGSHSYCLLEKTRENKDVDVFINVTTLLPTRPAPLDAKVDKKSLQSLPFAKKTFFPDSRFVNILMNEAPFELRGDEWNEILTIRGFNANVPFIIEAYVRGFF